MTVLSVCPVWKPRFPVDWRLLVEERIANNGIPLDVFCCCRLDEFFFLVLKKKKNQAFWSLQTSLLCIMGELAGGGVIDR